jgi:3'-phosphoadenosine 5'-phosphosulfate sulfotransferase (PAPS reductase)/FAD synthetase
MDPFFIKGPAVISVSGGRTSGMMLYMILQAHGGKLPADVIAIFANTGREMPSTLDFVRNMEANWNTPIVWLEFRHGFKKDAIRRHRWAAVVNYNSASRSGEPFNMLLESKQIVPDQSRRFCTEELKVLTIVRYLKAQHCWKHWTNVVGFRADESMRIINKQAKELAKPGIFGSVFPMADAGLTVMDVRRFWRSHAFDLQLDADGDGGNCDGCFMFSSERIGRMFKKYPERMDWWVNIEKNNGTKTMRPNQSYASIREIATNQGILAWDDGSPCDQGCGL